MLTVEIMLSDVKDSLEPGINIQYTGVTIQIQRENYPSLYLTLDKSNKFWRASLDVENLMNTLTMEYPFQSNLLQIVFSQYAESCNDFQFLSKDSLSVAVKKAVDTIYEMIERINYHAD